MKGIVLIHSAVFALFAFAEGVSAKKHSQYLHYYLIWYEDTTALRTHVVYAGKSFITVLFIVTGFV